jgi:hypothetical protein
MMPIILIGIFIVIIFLINIAYSHLERKEYLRGWDDGYVRGAEDAIVAAKIDGTYNG